MFFRFKKKQEEVNIISSEDVELEVKRFTPPAYTKWVVSNKDRINSLSLGAFSLIICNVLIEVSELAVKLTEKKKD